MTRFKNRWAAAAAAGLVTLSAGAYPTLIDINTAAAQGPDVSDNPSAIPFETANLHIHKFDKATQGAAGDGTQLNDTSNLGKPLAGAVFKVTKVDNVDLFTNEGWKTAAAIQKGQQDAVTSGPGTSATTNEQGVADFTDLEVGLYKVEETSAPSGYESFPDSTPFFVTLPITDPQSRASWLQDVHVYPKNKKQENVVTKTVDDAAAVTDGNSIKYTVNGKLPSASELGTVELTDLYPADRLSDPRATKVTYGNGQAATVDVDYTLDTTTPGEAKIVFTPEGLKKLDQLTGDARKVSADFEFTVLDAAGAADLGPVTNRAMINAKGKDSTAPDPNPNNPEDPNVTPEDQSPKTYYGNVEITKVGDNKEPLQDVKFDLYQCTSIDTLGAEPIKTDITTGAEGKAVIENLHVNDWVNNEARQTDPAGYCLVEKQAATGYALLAEPIYFEVKRDNAETIALTAQEISNVKNNAGFNLPLTGGAGATGLLVLGGIIMIGGTAYLVRYNRNEKQA